MPTPYDIFMSYAHADNDDGWVDSFATGLSSTYRKLTGTTPALFLDRESLITSDIWEKKIGVALNQSSLMLAVISPSYIRSPWCRREWDAFVNREQLLRSRGVLPDEQGLVFPLLLYPLERGRFGDDEKSFVAQVKRRHWLDVSSQIEGTPLRPSQLRELTESLIDTDAEIKIRERNVSTPSIRHRIISTVQDSILQIEWAAELSLQQLTIDEALGYVAQLDSANGTPWRLPTKQELASLIEPNAVSKDPKASPFPLRPPFNAQRFGLLHSGTYVDLDPQRGNFVMNVRNGHIFNGKGNRCFVRAVRPLVPNESHS